ncbi:hypothetical protein KL864_35005 [Mycolicibacterium goodii]|uniref:hypothetical protein n=1 Tax=Mycolicibacterium goodii TaxID=134601 RepID=UPI001BDD3541|nr:hypothetical protein [Mycolicibacterium goodii]MBU8821069.1 hypothetical protein [Mycolicibacterium goodii]
MTTAVYRSGPIDEGERSYRTVSINWVEQSHHRVIVRVPPDFDADQCDLENGLAELSDDGFEYVERSVTEVREAEDDPGAEFFNPPRYEPPASSGGDDGVIPGEVWTRFLQQEVQLDREHPGDVSVSAVVGEIQRLIAEHRKGVGDQ